MKIERYVFAFCIVLLFAICFRIVDIFNKKINVQERRIQTLEDWAGINTKISIFKDSSTITVSCKYGYTDDIKGVLPRCKTFLEACREKGEDCALLIRD